MFNNICADMQNVQNDIVAIADKNGDIVANYYYDALIGGVAGGCYGYNKAVKSNIPKGQRWRYVVVCGLVGAVIDGAIKISDAWVKTR